MASEPSVEYSEDFENKSPNGKNTLESPSGKYDGEFEPFESDADSMLLFGNAIDLTDNAVDDIPGTSPLPGEAIMDKYGDGFDASVDDVDASAEYNNLQLVEEGEDVNPIDGLSLSIDSSLSVGAIGGRELDEELLSDEENSIDQLISDLNESNQGVGNEMSRQLSIKKLLEMQEREETKAKEEQARKQLRKANKKTTKLSVGINSKPTLITKNNSKASSKSSKVSSLGEGNVSAANSIVSKDSSVSTINTLPQAVMPPKSANTRPGTTKSGGSSRAGTRTGARPPGNRGIAGPSRGANRGGSRGAMPLRSEAGLENFVPISQAPVTSHIGHDTKHDKAILERELDNAYKRIALYASENEKLRARLDHSALQQEFDTMKDILEQQDEKIEKLTVDKRGLEKITRAQGKSLVAMQHRGVADSLVTGPAMRIPVHKPAPYNNHYPPRNANMGLGSSDSSEDAAHPEPVLDPRDIQIRILVQRVRRNQLQIKDLRTKDKTTSRSLKKAEKSNEGLTAKVKSLTDSLNELAMHYNNNIAMVQQQSLQGDSVVSSTSKGGTSGLDPYSFPIGGNHPLNEGSSVFAGGGSSIIAGGGSSVIEGSSVLGATLSHVQDNMSTAHTVHALQHDVRKLQSIVDRQRTAHMKQVSGLRNALLHSQETKLKMQDEFMLQERTIKAQIAVVKQLKDTCEELADANQRLLLASDFYTQTNRPQQQQPPSPQPAPPPQPAMTRSFTRPVPKPASVGTQHLSKPKSAVMTSDFVVHGIESPPTASGPFSPNPESTDHRDGTFLTNSQG